MYSILIWKDHSINPNNTYTVKENSDGTVTLTPYGTVLQQGTNMSATNFNNMEFGIADADLAARILTIAARDANDRLTANAADITAAVAAYTKEFAVEEKTITLTNTAGYPFNNSVQTVSMTPARKNKNYLVEYSITTKNGNVGEVEISDKQLNGFKVAFTGSAKSVMLKLFIKGGTI